jgi:hypothetical protein
LIALSLHHRGGDVVGFGLSQAFFYRVSAINTNVGMVQFVL